MNDTTNETTVRHLLGEDLLPACGDIETGAVQTPVLGDVTCCQCQRLSVEPANCAEDTVRIDVRRTTTPACDLPLGLIRDVTEVLRVHGLDIQDCSEHVALLLALGQVVEAVAVERGGRRES